MSEDGLSVSTTWRQRGLLIVFGGLLAALVVGLAEGVLSLLGVAEAERFVDPYVGFEEGATLFALREGTQGSRYVTRPDKLKFFNPQEFPARKAADTLRIFTLGGSTTAGRPYDDHVSFSRWLERYLDAAEPTRRHEVINAGAISYASYRIVVLMKELVRYEPDVFVILTGHNEFLEERTYRDLVRQPKVLKWMRQRMARLRLTHLLWGALGQGSGDAGERLPDEVSTRLDVWKGLAAYTRDDALRRSITEHFGFNLQQMVEMARAHGVHVVLVKPASNLKDFSPFKSDHRAGLGDAERRRFQSLMAEGQRLAAAGAAHEALDALTAARALDPDYAEVHYRTAQTLLQQGSLEAAEAAFVAAKELDVAPLRSLNSLTQQVDATAARLQVPMIDLPIGLQERQAQRLGHRILGREVFLDHVHPDMATHSWIAEQLMRSLAQDDVIRLDPAWTAARRAAIYDAVVSTLDAEYYARRDLNLAKVLGWAGKLEEAEEPLRRAADVLAGDPDVHLNLGILWQKTGRPGAAAEQLRRAIDLDPASSEARFNLGVAYGRLGNLGKGIVELQEAIRLRPEYAEAHHNLSVLLRLNGDDVEAIEAARRAVEIEPDAAEAHRALGLAYRAAGRFEDAQGALSESLRLATDGPGLRTDLAVTLAMAGRLDAALDALDAALVEFPGDVELHYNRARTLAQLGRPDAAASAYGRVLQLDVQHVLANNNLGLLLARQGRLDEARQYLRRAIEGDPEFAEAWLNLGVVYDMVQRPDAALQAFEKAVALQPDNGKIRLGLAMLLWAAGSREASVPHFEAARRQGETVPPEILQQLGS